MKDYSKLTDRIYTQLSPELSQEFHNMLTEMAQEISRLYEIDNANPSEALVFIQELLNISETEKHFINLANYDITLNLVKTKQALLKAQEQDFNYKNIVMPFFDELVKLLGINDTDEMLEKIKVQEKVLSIIKEKNVDIDFLKSAETFDEYNRLIKFNICFATELTKEEFDTLKRWLNEMS